MRHLSSTAVKMICLLFWIVLPMCLYSQHLWSRFSSIFSEGAVAQVTPFDDKILEYMRAHGATRIGVFGSYARGEARADSDLDLLVWFSEQQSLLRLIRMERELSELVGKKI